MESKESVRGVKHATRELIQSGNWKYDTVTGEATLERTLALYIWLISLVLERLSDNLDYLEFPQGDK